MLRLTVSDPGERQARVIAEGRLVGEWTELLASECQTMLARGRAVALDLARLSDIDPQGVTVLRQLRTRGVAIQGLTPIMQALLSEESAP